MNFFKYWEQIVKSLLKCTFSKGHGFVGINTCLYIIFSLSSHFKQMFNLLKDWQKYEWSNMCVNSFIYKPFGISLTYILNTTVFI